jgi:hypothetical protein
MSTIEQRLAALEARSIDDEEVKPVLVQIIREGGATPEQEAAAADAEKAGTQVVRIICRDMRRRPACQGITESAPSHPGAS